MSTDPVAAERPSSPWIGALVLPTVGLHADWQAAMEWAGDFERCVAWCWMDARGLGV
jgi:hypothetical protein